MVKSPSTKFMGSNVLVMLLSIFLVNVGATYAEEKKNYNEEQVKQIKKLMENEIVPLSKKLSPLLREVLPKKDGKKFPLIVRYPPGWPNDSDRLERIVFQCVWGKAVCEPFMQACRSLGYSCSCSDYGAIEADPC